MREKIAKISGTSATIGAVAIVISNFVGEWFWDILDWWF